MFGMPATVRVLVAVSPADLRKGYDGLAQLARDAIKEDPLSGHLFVFSNRKRNRIKIIYWDRDGYRGLDEDGWKKGRTAGPRRLPITSSGRPPNSPRSSAAST